MRDKTLDLTVDEWMGMYHIAADRADKAESENALLRKVAEAARAWLEFDDNVGLDIRDDGADNQAKAAYRSFIRQLKQALAALEKESNA